MDSFKKEFSALLLQYTSLKTSINDKTTGDKLSHQEVLNLIHEALRETLNINLQTLSPAALKTPANDIIVSTPDAPDVLKNNYNLIGNPMQLMPPPSLAFFPSCDYSRLYAGNACEIPDQIDEKPESAEEEEEKDLMNFTNNNSTEIKVTPRSESDAESKPSPIPKRLRSKTLAAINEKVRSNNSSSKMDNTLKADLYNLVEDAHLHSMELNSIVQELREQLRPDIRPIRRLSTVMSLSPSKPQQRRHSMAAGFAAGPCCTMRTIQRAHAFRRSSIYAGQASYPSVTPTTSRPAQPLHSTPPLITIPVPTSTPHLIKSSEKSKKKVDEKKVETPAVKVSRNDKSAVDDGDGKKISVKLTRSKSVAKAAAAANSRESSGQSKKTDDDDDNNNNNNSSKVAKKVNRRYSHVQSTIPKASGLPVKRRGSTKK